MGTESAQSTFACVSLCFRGPLSLLPLGRPRFLDSLDSELETSDCAASRIGDWLRELFCDELLLPHGLWASCGICIRGAGAGEARGSRC